jgi:predicted dehydrogenase
MKELKAGIVGAGGIANYHISGYLKSRVSVCAIDTKTTEEKVKIF